MKIKLTVSMAGADFALNAGEETERFSASEAARLVAAGYAVPVAEQKIERAVKPAFRETRKKAGN